MKGVSEEVVKIAVGRLVPMEGNVRSSMDKKSLQELADSIKQDGVSVPLIIRKHPDQEEADAGAYQVVCGHRRLAAGKLAGLTELPCIIRELEDADARDLNIMENLQRENLSALDEAQTFTRIVAAGHEAHELAVSLGKSDKYVQDRLKLLTLNKTTLKALKDGVIQLGHALTLLRVPDAERRSELLERTMDEKMSVRGIEEQLAYDTENLKTVKFDKAECKACPHNGCNQTELFDNNTELNGRCLNKQCFEKKQDEYVAQALQKYRDQGVKVYGKDDKKPRHSAISDFELEKKDFKACPKCPSYAITITPYSKEVQPICTNTACYNKKAYGRNASSGSSDKAFRARKKKLNELRKAVAAAMTAEVSGRLAMAIMLGRCGSKVCDRVTKYKGWNSTSDFRLMRFMADKPVPEMLKTVAAEYVLQAWDDQLVKDLAKELKVVVPQKKDKPNTGGKAK